VTIPTVPLSPGIAINTFYWTQQFITWKWEQSQFPKWSVFVLEYWMMDRVQKRAILNVVHHR
jgi:hypothetical protein